MRLSFTLPDRDARQRRDNPFEVQRVYANWVQDAFTVKFGGDYGWGASTVNRQVTFLPENDTSHVGNYTAQIYGEAGYSVKFNDVNLEPYADLAWVKAYTSPFTETGGPISDLTGTGTTNSVGYSTLSVHLGTDPLSLGGLAISPKVTIGRQFGFNSFRPSQSVNFTSITQSFQTLGVSLNNSAAVTQLGFDIAIAPQVKLSLSYDGLISDREQENTLKADFDWKF
jgi:fibronectin-binding autotransporter adhesin